MKKGTPETLTDLETLLHAGAIRLDAAVHRDQIMAEIRTRLRPRVHQAPPDGLFAQEQLTLADVPAVCAACGSPHAFIGKCDARPNAW